MASGSLSPSSAAPARYLGLDALHSSLTAREQEDRDSMTCVLMAVNQAIQAHHDSALDLGIPPDFDPIRVTRPLLAHLLDDPSVGLRHTPILPGSGSIIFSSALCSFRLSGMPLSFLFPPIFSGLPCSFPRVSSLSVSVSPLSAVHIFLVQVPL